MMKRPKDIFLAVTGFLLCPCHLPFVLPALAAGLAGTALGSFIAGNTLLIIAVATIYFVGVVAYFVKGANKKGSVEERGSEQV